MVWSLWFGHCGFAILVHWCGLVAIGLLCRSVAISLSLRVDCYESVTLKDLINFLHENSLTLGSEKRMNNAGAFDPEHFFCKKKNYAVNKLEQELGK